MKNPNISRQIGQDFDLNVIPVVDFFSVLILYLLVSASFFSIAAIDVGVAALGTGSVTLSTSPVVSMRIDLHSDRSVTLNITGGPRAASLQATFVKTSDSDWDFSKLNSKLGVFRDQYAANEVTVQADPDVRYKDVVRAIESLKTVVGKVYLLG